MIAEEPGGFCLWVFETNTPARGFYARHGLVELERTDGAGNEEKQPDIRMAWLLTMEASWKMDQGTLTRYEASMVNVQGSEMVGRVADHQRGRRP